MTAAESRKAWTEGRLGARTSLRARFCSRICTTKSSRETDCPELWVRFAEGLGANRAEVKAQELLPETRTTVNSFFDLTSRDWTQGLCALFAYEWQVPEVAASKMDGLKKFYGVDDDRTFSFFKVHLAYDVEHSQAVADLIDQHASAETAERATREAAQALGGFLDGISRQANIACVH